MNPNDLSPGEKDELGLAAYIAEYPPINREGVEPNWPRQRPSTKAMYLEQALYIVKTWEELKERRRVLDQYTKFYFFGCAGKQVGHYLFEAFEGGSYEHAKTGTGVGIGPWPSLDGKLVPKIIRGLEEPEGLGFLTRKGGWTALSFWDRSVDKRYASNFHMIVDRDTTAAEVLRLAQRRIPDQLARFPFEIQIVNVDGNWV